jgi:NAD(P)-dependent dehydrogenase (short-subunit alcohol dehydrogenase family)
MSSLSDLKPLAEMLRLDGKVAIVTGGARGIGRGIVLRLAEAGAFVLVADREFSESMAIDPKKDGKVQVLQVDMEKTDAGDKIVHGALRVFGRVDILVNNAGIYPFKPALDLTPEEWDRVLNVNLRGPFLAAQAFGRHVRDRKEGDGGEGGVIVNIGSVDSLHPGFVGTAAYDSSKGGILMFTRNFALEVAPLNIRVNLVAPGLITTEGTSGANLEEVLEEFKALIPMRRTGVPDDIATVVLMLCTPFTAYMTGATVVVDGGRLLK